MATKKSKTGLGPRGWSIVLGSFFLYMLGTGIVTDFLNITVPAIAAKHEGWSTAVMMTFSTVAGWVTLVVAFLVGSIIQKTGARKIMIISMLCFTVAAFFMGSVTQMWQYAVCVLVIAITDATQSGMAMQTVIAAWFPKKKGIVMGWATLGLTFSTCCFLPLFTWLNQTLGIARAYNIIGLIALAVCIYNAIVIRNLPEEVGLAPDNDANYDAKAAQEEAAKTEAYMRTSPWTLKKLLKTKQVWQISCMLGCGMMVATGVLSQFVPRMASLGVDQGVAVSIMSLCCFIGFPFSPLWGYLDAKFGTKRVTSFLMCLYLVGLILMILVGGNIVGTCVAICIFYAALGGINNMLTSYTTSVFGRYDFPSANKLMYPIYNAVRCCAFAIVGISSALAGGNYTVTYTLLAICQAIAIVVSFCAKDDLIGRERIESAEPAVSKETT